jgi:hypothetical protein
MGMVCENTVGLGFMGILFLAPSCIPLIMLYDDENTVWQKHDLNPMGEVRGHD